MAASKFIRELVVILNEEERTTVRSYLKAFDHRLQNQESKMARLYELFLTELKTGELVSERDLEREVYGGMNPSAFSKLLLRLRDKLLETLLIDVNINREGAYCDRSKLTIQLRKQITQAQVLQDRGLRDVAAQLFRNVADSGIKHELYEEATLALRLLINNTLLTSGQQAITKLMKIYENADYASRALFRSEMTFTTIGTLSDFQSGQIPATEKYQTALAELRSDYGKTNSTLIGYRYFMLETHYYQTISDFRKARKSISNIILLLDASPVIYTPVRMGLTLLNQAENDIYLGNLNRSYNTIMQVMRHFKKNSFNYQLAQELLFLNCFYSGNYEQAHLIIDELLSEGASDSDFKQGKRLYYKASLLFLMNQPQKCSELIGTINPIEEDKKGWNIGIRLLNLLCLLEVEAWDDFERRVDTFRKYFEKNKIQSERLMLLVDLLKSLVRNNGSYKLTYQENASLFALLSSTDRRYNWKILSFETIDIAKWIYSKAVRQTYQLHPNELKTAGSRVLKKQPT